MGYNIRHDYLGDESDDWTKHGISSTKTTLFQRILGGQAGYFRVRINSSHGK